MLSAEELQKEQEGLESVAKWIVPSLEKIIGPLDNIPKILILKKEEYIDARTKEVQAIVCESLMSENMFEFNKNNLAKMIEKEYESGTPCYQTTHHEIIFPEIAAEVLRSNGIRLPEILTHELLHAYQKNQGAIQKSEFDFGLGKEQRSQFISKCMSDGHAEYITLELMRTLKISGEIGEEIAKITKEEIEEYRSPLSAHESNIIQNTINLEKTGDLENVKLSTLSRYRVGYLYMHKKEKEGISTKELVHLLRNPPKTYEHLFSQILF